MKKFNERKALYRVVSLAVLALLANALSKILDQSLKLSPASSLSVFFLLALLAVVTAQALSDNLPKWLPYFRRELRRRLEGYWVDEYLAKDGKKFYGLLYIYWDDGYHHHTIDIDDQGNEVYNWTGTLLGEDGSKLIFDYQSKVKDPGESGTLGGLMVLEPSETATSMMGCFFNYDRQSSGLLEGSRRPEPEDLARFLNSTSKEAKAMAKKALKTQIRALP